MLQINYSSADVGDAVGGLFMGRPWYMSTILQRILCWILAGLFMGRVRRRRLVILQWMHVGDAVGGLLMGRVTCYRG